MNPQILSDKFRKLLDAGEAVVVYRNGLGSYTAAAIAHAAIEEKIEDIDDVNVTDHFTPTQALNALAEKVGDPNQRN